ncbi:MAG: N-acetylmuramoyl-L-alanine amidase [Deltaproteobacteria bacterium]|nr:N-acetylmuramoyl-L-alanine amidase [Deltaproteobacteria bacterium]
MHTRQTTPIRRLIIASSVAASLLVHSAHARADGPEAARRIAQARASEAELSGDQKRLRMRHNIEALIRDWQRAGAVASGAQKIEATEGEARAFALLARWSGLASDRQSAARASERAVRAAGAAGGAGASQARAKPVVTRPERQEAGNAAWLTKIEIENSELGVEVLLPKGAALSARSEKIPGRGEQPARFYFDVSPLVAAKQALGTVAIDHPAIERLRVGQFDARTVRFVFDLPRGKETPSIAELVEGASPRLRLATARPAALPASPIAEWVPPVPPVPSRAERPPSTEASDPSGNAPKVSPSHQVLADLEKAMEEVVPESSSHDVLSPEAQAALDAIVGELRGGDAPSTAVPTARGADKGGPSRDTGPVAGESSGGGASGGAASGGGASGASGASGGEAPALSKTTRDALLRRRDGLVRVRRVVIDPGHGGKDTGAIGKAGVREKDVNLSIALALGAALEKRLGVEVIYTRNKDHFITLSRRVQIAHAADADLLISVHANAHKNRKLSGIETYYLNTTSSGYANRLAQRENSQHFDEAHLDAPDPEESTAEEEPSVLPSGALGRDLRLLLADLAMRSATEDSKHLAGLVQSRLVKSASEDHPGVRDLGVKHALFFVLLGARMPSILIETGFLSHPEEERRLGSRAYQRTIAEAIARAVERFAEERNQVAARM